MEVRTECQMISNFNCPFCNGGLLVQSITYEYSYNLKMEVIRTPYSNVTYICKNCTVKIERSMAGDGEI